MSNDKTGAGSATTSAVTGAGRSRRSRPGIRRGQRLGGLVPAASAVTLIASAGLTVAGVTKIADAVNSASSSPRRTIVLEREVNSSSQVFVRNLSGTRQHQLTFGHSAAEMPRWAPFGHRILYLRRPPDDAHSPDLMVMGARGRNKRQLLAGGRSHFIYDMAWSPSGRRIVLVRSLPNGSSDLWVYTLATATLTRMRVNSGPDRDPATVDWAPDGRIFFSAVDYADDGDAFEDHDLYVVRPDGTGLAQLTDTPLRDELRPRVSPDGQKLAYARRSIRCWSVWIANTDATSSVRLPTDCNAVQASWSSNGRRVLLQKFDRTGEFVIRVMAPDGTHRRLVTRGEDPDWRPDAH